MKTINTIKRRIRDSAAYWQVLSKPETSHMYKVYRLSLDDTEDLLAAKMLHAGVYLSRGFIDETDIRDGIIHEQSDPHQLHAEYFVVKRKGEVVALARQIVYKGDGDHDDSFPLLSNAIIHERSRRRLASVAPIEVVEISALAKKRGESSVAPLILYRALWRHSLRSKHRIWIMACDVRLYERLKLLFGPALTVIGKRTHYKGGDIIPVSLDIADSVNYVQKIVAAPKIKPIDLRRRAARFMIKEEVNS